MTDIILSVHRSSWSAPIQHGSVWDKNKAMVKVRDKILKRDNYTCQGCGWRAKNFQEIHHKNHNHGDFRESNLEVLCPLCHQVFHLSTASISSGGYLIWLPEISQAQLNRLLFPLFSTLKSGQAHPFFSVAKAVYTILEMRKVFLENQIGRSDPGVFGQMLLNLSKEEYENRHKTMSAIKMMANPSRFETEIDYWKAMIDKEKTPEQWLEWTKSLPFPQNEEGNQTSSKE